MSTLRMLLQVWEKILYLAIWCQILLGKIWCQKWDGERWGKAPKGNILTTGGGFVPNVRVGGQRGVGTPEWIYWPQVRILCPPYVRGSPDWVDGMTGAGDHCKQRAGRSCSTPSPMWGSWYLPRLLFRGTAINRYVHGLFIGSSDALWFPAHYGVFQFDDVFCSLGMVKDVPPIHSVMPPLLPPLFIWHKFLPCSKYVPPGVLPLSLPFPFGAIFFPPNFGAKLVSIALSLRPEEVLLVLTSWKLVWIHV